jgi:hypothetical protein
MIMKNKLMCFLLMLIVSVSFAHAQRYHYDVDEESLRRRDNGYDPRYDDERESDWRYRERYRPRDRDRRRDESYAPYDRYEDRYDDYYTDPYPYTDDYPFFLEFSANDEAMELALGHVWAESERNFRTTFGGSVLYSDDQYQFFNLFFLLGNRMLFERFRFDIGFKGVFGTVERDDDTEGDVSAVGFSLAGAYDFPEIEAIYGLPLDFELSSSFTVAPDPLCFQDLDSYREFRITGGLYVLEQKKGMIFIGYRAIDTSFDEGAGDDGDEEWDELDDSFVFGYRFIF